MRIFLDLLGEDPVEGKPKARSSAQTRSDKARTATAGRDMFQAAAKANADAADGATTQARLEQFQIVYQREGNPTYGVWEGDLPEEVRPFVPRFIREGVCQRAAHCGELLILEPKLRIPNDLDALVAECRQRLRAATRMDEMYTIRDDYQMYRDEHGMKPFWDAWAAAIVERGPAWLLAQDGREKRLRKKPRLNAWQQQVLHRVVTLGEQAETLLYRLRRGQRWRHPRWGTGLWVSNVLAYSPNTFVVPLVVLAAVKDGDLKTAGALLAQVAWTPEGRQDEDALRRTACTVSGGPLRGRACKKGGPGTGRALLLRTVDGAILACAPAARKVERQVSCVVHEAKVYARAAAEEYFENEMEGRDGDCCGYAWVEVSRVPLTKRAELEAAGFARASGSTLTYTFEHGVDTQSLSCKEAANRAAAETLRIVGFRARMRSMVD